MAEKMLVTQALDERSLLEKKIRDKIEKASFVDCIKKNEERVIKTYKEKAAYIKEAEASYQQIVEKNRLEKTLSLWGDAVVWSDLHRYDKTFNDWD